LNHLQQSVYGGGIGRTILNAITGAWEWIGTTASFVGAQLNATPGAWSWAGTLASLPFFNGPNNLFWLNTAQTQGSGVGSAPSLTTPGLGAPTTNDCVMIFAFHQQNGPGTAQVPVATVTDSNGNTLALAVTNAQVVGSTAVRNQLNWIRVPGGVTTSYQVTAQLTGVPTGTFMWAQMLVLDSTTPISSSIQVDATQTYWYDPSNLVPPATNFNIPISPNDNGCWGFAAASIINDVGADLDTATGQPAATTWVNFTRSLPMALIGFEDTLSQHMLAMGAPGATNIPCENAAAVSESIVCSAFTLTRY
jgi:hypothetical protein